MTQLVAVSASLLTVAVVIIKLMFYDGNISSDHESLSEYHEPLLRYVVILLVNFLAAFFAFQNVQIVALQKHIESLEEKLGNSEVFRWESKVARVWFGSGGVAAVFPALLVVPPALVLLLVYYDLHQVIQSEMGYLVVVFFNVLYLSVFILCYRVIVKKLETVIE